MKRIIFLLILVTISCTKKDVFETVELVEIYPKCDRSKESKTLVTKNIESNPLVSSLEDIIHHPYGFEYEISLPNEYEFCGHIPIFFCSVGEPITYYSIDSTLTRELFIIVETNKRDQKRYDYFDPNLRDSIIAEQKRDDLKYGLNEQSKEEILKSLGMVYLESIMGTKSMINGTLFYGSGQYEINTRGQFYCTYEIYGKKGNVLIGLKTRITGINNKLDIDQLYCTLSSMQLLMY